MVKKILISIGRLSGGGAERVATIWANELYKRGYFVSILVGFRVDDEYEVNPEIDVYSIAANDSDFVSLSYRTRLRKMRDIIKKIKPDYIIPFLPKMQMYMLLSSIGTNAKRIETIRVNPWKVNSIGDKAKLLWKVCYHTADKIILQSSDQEPFFNKMDQKKCFVIPNPIAEAYKSHYKMNNSNNVCEFIAAGRIGKQKNYELMIKAFSIACKKNANIRLRIFGTGSDEYLDYLKRIILENNVEQNIFFMGRSNSMEVEYKKSDVFLMTSDFEGLPNALMEAMASKLICISTDCKTGPRDLIDDGKNGFLSPVGNVLSFAEKIEYVMEMGLVQRKKMANLAREKVMNYCSKEHCTDLLCQLLK